MASPGPLTDQWRLWVLVDITWSGAGLADLGAAQESKQPSSHDGREQEEQSRRAQGSKALLLEEWQQISLELLFRDSRCLETASRGSGMQNELANRSRAALRPGLENLARFARDSRHARDARDAGSGSRTTSNGQVLD